MSGNCSARPNKSTVGGVQVVVHLEGKSREEEVGVLSADEVSGGFSKVRNIPETAHTHTQRCNLNHARVKLARVMRAKCLVLFTHPV